MSDDFDLVLDLCQDKHRRIILGVLATERRPLTLNDLTKTVLKHNHQMPLTEISEEALTPIRVSMHHQHIPRLTAAEIIRYDPKRRLVEPTAEFERVEPYLSVILEADPDLEPPVDL
ncbi:hypothetical protein QA600_20805 [Natronococcus sp. A-GB1]|uniref:DUF7344 domain-containing protein n=1 Tax=Natronococcus sp. A-GB1 TaxID=3037648 RepID=UPI00241C721B|nr:hypothetical protein [Natronococcus sp. A-GB1]MDG5761766.1 hypothetical protein [Natronococcus sp. A-GB1]